MDNSNLRKKKEDEKRSYQKAAIPKAIREQVWLITFGKKYEHKCYIPWCKNKINVFDYHVGHDIPESEGGTLDIYNLRPICARCNLSMSNRYTIREWIKLTKKKSKCCRYLCCFTLICY